MANTLDNLMPDIYKAADKVGRELVGAIPSITVNSGIEGAAINQTIRSHFTRESAVVDNPTPAMTIPEGTDQTVDNKTMTITKDKAVQIPWTGEDVKKVSGSGFETIYGDQIQQAFRKISNLIEADVCAEIGANTSRVVGVAGTTPFGSNYNVVNEARQVLVDNGCAIDEVTMVMNTLAGTNMRNLSNLQKVNEAGNAELLRQGTLLDLSGIMLKESAGIQSHTAGTGASYLLNGAVAVGDTSIDVDTGSGTILAGDVVTIGNHNYTVETALASGTFVLTSAIVEAAADNSAITVFASRTQNFMLHKDAAEVAIRPPAMPEGGDDAVDRQYVLDEHSGLVFAVSLYTGYRKNMIEVASVWGYKAWKPDFISGVAG